MTDFDTNDTVTPRNIPATAADLIEQQIYDLRIDSAFLRMRSHEEPNAHDGEILRRAAEELSRVTSRLERAVRKHAG